VCGVNRSRFGLVFESVGADVVCSLTHFDECGVCGVCVIVCGVSSTCVLCVIVCGLVRCVRLVVRFCA
jgi:hypothetical protein